MGSEVMWWGETDSKNKHQRKEKDKIQIHPKSKGRKEKSKTGKRVKNIGWWKERSEEER